MPCLLNQVLSTNVLDGGDTGESRRPFGPSSGSREITMRRLENYVRKYGPEFGPRLYHALQSQAAHAGVSARLRRKIDILSGKTPAPRKPDEASLPLFPEGAAEAPEHAGLMPVGA